MTQQTTATPSTPTDVWAALKEGNERFATDETLAPNRDTARRQSLTAGQNPVAAVIACSDSRVPVELLLDAGFGDVFVIRNAGGCIDSSVAGSVDFAVQDLGVSLVLFLSHERCGAVGTAIQGVNSAKLPTGLTRVFVEKIAPSVLTAQADGPVDSSEIERTHARVTATHLLDRIPSLRKGIDDGTVGLVGARYRLEDGRVETVYENFGG